VNTTRREFMRQVGVTLAGLLLSGCDLGSRLTLPPTPSQEPFSTPPFSCYQSPAAPPYVDMSYELRSHPRWIALRDRWLELKDPKLKALEDTDFSRGLRQRHADALKALVDNTELDAAVADEIGVAFEQAIAHIQRQTAACCYEPLPPEYTPRQNLTTQAAVLNEVAQRSSIDVDTVDRAKAALERDIAWLSQFQAGQIPGKLESIEVTPVEAQAALTLVTLLLIK